MLPAKADSLMLASTESYEGQKSIAISVKDIAEQINEEIYSILNVGSMAYEDACNYAKRDHDHDIYTSADYFQTGTGDHLESFLTLAHNSKRQVLSVNVDKSADDKIPKIEATISAAQPKLGEIRHLALQSFSIPSYDSTEFFGWVLANGATYRIADFKLSGDIPNVFSTSGANFTVPNLNNFCKINVALNASSYDVTNAEVHVKSHGHGVVANNAKLFIKEVTNISSYDGGAPNFYCNSKTGGGGFMASEFAHNGRGKSYTCECSSYNDIRTDVFNKSGLQTMPMNDPSRSLPETYPSHNYLPTLVYVGPGKNTPPFFQP